MLRFSRYIAASRLKLKGFATASKRGNYIVPVLNMSEKAEKEGKIDENSNEKDSTERTNVTEEEERITNLFSVNRPRGIVDGTLQVILLHSCKRFGLTSV